MAGVSITVPRVSVLIPTYNRPVLIVRAIESVLSQTYASFELLIIDDCGSQETKPIVEAIAKRDSRVRYIGNEVRLGLMENKNKGVRLSSPSVEYIALLDDDDAYLPYFLERTIAEFEADNDLMAVSTDAELRTQEGKFLKRDVCEKKNFWNVSLGGGSVVRKTIFTKFGIWYDKDMMFEDWDFGVRVARFHKWKGIPEVLRIYYRYHMSMGASMSTMYTKQTLQEYFERFYNIHHKEFEAAGPFAVSHLHALTGKMLLRAGHVAAGRKHITAAFKIHPTLSLALYGCMATVYPRAFSNLTLIIWKNKIKGWFDCGV